MANTKKLQKVAAKFRKTEPYLHTVISQVLGLMAQSIKANGAPEVTAVVHNNSVKIYAND